jgi:hypothetical protein
MGWTMIRVVSSALLQSPSMPCLRNVFDPPGTFLVVGERQAIEALTHWPAISLSGRFALVGTTKTGNLLLPSRPLRTQGGRKIINPIFLQAPVAATVGSEKIHLIGQRFDWATVRPPPRRNVLIAPLPAK